MKDKEIPTRANMSEHNVAEVQNIDIDVQIFCDGAVRKEVNRMGIDCIAYDRHGTILATISKWTHGDFPTLAEIFLLLKRIWIIRL